MPPKSYPKLRTQDGSATLRAILALAKARFDRAAAASRAASTGTALTASVEKVSELQYAMGRGEEAFAAFKEIAALCREAGVE